MLSTNVSLLSVARLLFFEFHVAVSGFFRKGRNFGLYMLKTNITNVNVCKSLKGALCQSATCMIRCKNTKCL